MGLERSRSPFPRETKVCPPARNARPIPAARYARAIFQQFRPAAGRYAQRVHIGAMSQKATYHCSSECIHSTVHATRYTFCVCFIFRLVCSWERRGGTANSVRLVASAEKNLLETTKPARNGASVGYRSGTFSSALFCNAAEHDYYTTLCYFLQQSVTFCNSTTPLQI